MLGHVKVVLYLGNLPTNSIVFDFSPRGQLVPTLNLTEGLYFDFMVL